MLGRHSTFTGSATMLDTPTPIPRDYSSTHLQVIHTADIRLQRLRLRYPVCPGRPERPPPSRDQSDPLCVRSQQEVETMLAVSDPPESQCPLCACVRVSSSDRNRASVATSGADHPDDDGIRVPYSYQMLR